MKLSPKERQGLIGYITVSGISLVSVLVLLGCFLTRRQVIRPIGLFFLLLLFWELVQAMAGFMTLRWVLLGDVKAGTFCVAQAILNMLNPTGTALSTIILSWCILHNYVFLTGDLSLKHAFFILATMSILQMLLVLVPGVVVGADKLFQPSGIWCWLPVDHYYALKVLTTYLFYWMAVGFSLFSAGAYLASAYVNNRLPSDYFWIGFLTRQNGLLRIGFFSELEAHGRVPMFGFTLDVLWFERNKSILFVQYLGPPPQPVIAEPGPPNHARLIRAAMKLLLFPLTYAFFVIPLSVVRFTTFKGQKLGSAGTIVTGTWFALTGFAEVVLFVWLEPDFGLRMPREPVDRRPLPLIPIPNVPEPPPEPYLNE